MTTRPWSIGIDVGSTTVKAVLVDTSDDGILWSDYQRHEGRQLVKVLELLRAVEAIHPEVAGPDTRIFATGSGAAALETCVGAKFVQEVNAVALAVERLHPEVGSVVELGGQDAKIIIFKDDPSTGGKKKIPTMNDKCAGGTGAVLDKISAKLGIPAQELAEQRYDGLELHHVAGKCGVFAETDINSLQLVGIPTDQLMASLFDAIVGQNLSVLTRGHTLRPHVLLLGGPNTFIRGMAEAWKANIPPIWEERGVELPEGVDPASLIYVPAHAQYFAALGAVEYGTTEDADVGRYQGTAELEREIARGGGEARAAVSAGLSRSAEELADFKERYRPVPFTPATFAPGDRVRAYLGLDGGSTSTKGVLLDGRSRVLAKAYQLSRGNPIEDTKEILGKLRDAVEGPSASLEIVGFGVTGYAKDVLKDVFGADVAIVETVAHTASALHFYDDVDVICDVGGQDIKIMILKGGQVKDFKLNTQCSAGNGYFLQSTAQGLGIPVEDYAEVAFAAESMPTFGYGCAVFMQSDIVNFQRQGWRPDQIMAGLAAVLPKNIWLYVAQIPNLARLGTRFVLQGGTQHNLAAVKAQVDFIRSRFEGQGVEPHIVVHRHCGESGAIGAALEAMRVIQGRDSSFVGLDRATRTTYTTTTDERTRCRFCKNACLRTFIDVQVSANGMGPPDAPTVSTHGHGTSDVPLPSGARRLIVGNSCEKGLVESVDDMRVIKAGIDATVQDTPNLVEESARAAFRSYSPDIVAEPPDAFALTSARRRRARLVAGRETLRIGMPRVLAMYAVAPLFRSYFESLGVPSRNIVFSDRTSPTLYKEGAKRGAIDPCFPSKLAIPHVHNLLHVKHGKNPLDIVFFPMVDDVPSELESAIGHRVCPTIVATPEATRAAFTKEGDDFARRGIRFLNTFVNIGQPEVFQRQMYRAFRDVLGVSARENREAIEAGLGALAEFSRELRSSAKAALRRLERDDRIGLVLLGRPYHADPGINHDILGEFQKLGYPIFTPASLPVDPEVLEPLFGEEVRAGIISDPLDIRDVWKNAYSENSNWKLWAAKFTARHPNLVALELSSFRCGHDAPILSVVEGIIETSGTPYFCFKDLDENKPSGSIKIRVETIHYFLRRFRDGLVSKEEVRRRTRAEFTARHVGPCPPARSAAPLIRLTVG
jgi:activator of 2-hydroxyglutaryl-CoA dehydratase/predicted nucleotide-binding protein (sugar kinase/HSP70/actin superfamily)